MAHQNILEQGRAKASYDLAKKRVVPKNSKNDEFKSYAKKIPMMIKNSGLGATFAFMQAKGGTYDCILQDIRTWLATSDFKIADISKETNLVAFVIEQNSSVYRALTNEVLAFMSWYRRFMEGLTSENLCKEPKENKN